MAESLNSEFFINPHAAEKDELFSIYETRDSGLNAVEAEERIEKFGRNEIPDPARKNRLQIFIKQFKSLLILVLFLAAIFSWFTEHEIDAYVILGVILINTMIGFLQESKAEKAVEALKKMSVPSARVIRDDQVLEIPTPLVVPGDILVVDEGDQIAADARIIYAKDVRTIESALTGESVPVEKTSGKQPEETVLADQKNMLHKGTFIATGYAKAIVTSTGLFTSLGKIAESISGIEKKRTHFQVKTDKLAQHMATIAITSASLLFFTGWLIYKLDFEEMVMVSVAALVSSIPEGLPAVLSIVLAIGAHRMSQRNAIIREFNATETLGAVTCIITDKTGTLTQNTLTVRKLYTASETIWEVTGEGWEPTGEFVKNSETLSLHNIPPDLSRIFEIASLSNNATLFKNSETGKYDFSGDPTEAGLLAMAGKAGFHPSGLDHYEKIDDLPFNSSLKMRASIIKNRTGISKLFAIGAPEIVLDRCSAWLDQNGEIREMTHEKREKIRKTIEGMSLDALRVIGFAFGDPKKEERIKPQLLTGMVFSGLAGMMDPPRSDVPDAVRKCRQAGIRVIMATGDHVNTAIAMAEITGIADCDNREAFTEKELAEMDEKVFEQTVKSVNIFARLSPDMKMKITDVLQKQGELVAMTGDGVNDAPALKKADAGISMGIMGTDVARDASKMVLADDNFSTIVNAVEEGRIVFTNARQTSFYLLTTNFAEISTLITAISMGLPIPLTATQILWLNLVTDGICDISLATEKGHGDELKFKPIKRTENILNRSVFPFLVINALVMTVFSVGAFHWFLDDGIDKARTSAFIVMAFCQIFNVFNMRSLRHSIFEIGFFSNKYINIGITVSVIIQVLIIEITFFEILFSFAFISATEFIVFVMLASSVLWSGELYKRFIGIKINRHAREGL